MMSSEGSLRHRRYDVLEERWTSSTRGRQGVTLFEGSRSSTSKFDVSLGLVTTGIYGAVAEKERMIVRAISAKRERPNLSEDFASWSIRRRDDFWNHRGHVCPIEHRSNRADVGEGLWHYLRLRYHLERVTITEREPAESIEGHPLFRSPPFARASWFFHRFPEDFLHRRAANRTTFPTWHNLNSTNHTPARTGLDPLPSRVRSPVKCNPVCPQPHCSEPGRNENKTWRRMFLLSLSLFHPRASEGMNLKTDNRPSMSSRYEREQFTEISETNMSFAIKKNIVGPNETCWQKPIWSTRRSLLDISMNITQFVQRINRQDHFRHVEASHLFGEMIVEFR